MPWPSACEALGRTSGAETRVSGGGVVSFASPDLDTRLSMLSMDAPYIVYCHTGRRSAVVTGRMHDLGFKHVYDLQGGLTAWQQVGVPVTS
jgi:rhodanese-related sulfurtransferase